MRRTHVGSTHTYVTIALTALAALLALTLLSASPAHAACTTTGSATGTAGDDRMCGTTGADSMNGLAGKDRLTGGDGNDTLLGGDGNDTVLGGNGNDTVLGGLGSDVLSGDAGNDSMRLRDGQVDNAGVFSCGSGTDSADLDLADAAFLGIDAVSGLLTIFAIDVLANCERITVGAVNEGPNAVISRRTPKIADNGKVPVRLACPAELTTPCAGTVQLGRSENSEGSPKAYSLDPGGSEKVKARLSRRDRRKLSRSGEITVRALSVEQGEFGDKTTVQTLELTAQRKRHT